MKSYDISVLQSSPDKKTDTCFSLVIEPNVLTFSNCCSLVHNASRIWYPPMKTLCNCVRSREKCWVSRMKLALPSILVLCSLTLIFSSVIPKSMTFRFLFPATWSGKCCFMSSDPWKCSPYRLTLYRLDYWNNIQLNWNQKTDFFIFYANVVSSRQLEDVMRYD